jgi:hypothetical protein
MEIERIQIITKLCSRCKATKGVENFYVDKHRLDGYKPWCRNCCSEYWKIQWKKDPDKFRERGRRYYDNHKEKSSEYHTGYYQANKEKLKTYTRQWTKDNADKIKSYRSTPEAKEKRRLLKRAWDRKRAADPLFRIGNNIRTSMCHALKGKKGFRKWETLVGYTLEDLIKHLSPLLKDGMTWGNYGELWQIDHITPKSWYKYESAEHPLFKECWALNNLQPKLTEDNRKKGNRFKG